MTATRQLGLPFTHQPTYDPADFLAHAGNEAALAWLEAPWPGGRLAVWGAAGSGKTHLLRVWAARTGAVVLDGAALDAPVLAPAVAIDDADRARESSLLHQINAAAEAGRAVLLAARAAPSRWQPRLPDLRSRLGATAAVELGPPDDAVLRTLFAHLLLARQLAVPAPVQDWLLLRLPREPGALREAAARLDGMALAAGRRVSLGLAAELVRDQPAL